MPQHRENRSRLNNHADRTIPLFVCAGARDVKYPYALFPHGDDCSTMQACPMRQVCFWHAGHDLGGADRYNEFPHESLLPVAFKRRPYFSCENFEIDEED